MFSGLDLNVAGNHDDVGVGCARHWPGRTGQAIHDITHTLKDKDTDMYHPPRSNREQIDPQQTSLNMILNRHRVCKQLLV